MVRATNNIVEFVALYKAKASASLIQMTAHTCPCACQLVLVIQQVSGFLLIVLQNES